MGNVTGISDTLMKIYCIVWMDGPVSQDEIENSLKEQRMSIGKASISNHLSRLERGNAIETVSRENDRKKYYQVSSELTDLFQNMMSMLLGPAKLEINTFTKKYKDDEMGQKMIKEMGGLYKFFEYMTELEEF